MEQKLRLAETREPGARVCSVAVSHGVNETRMFTRRPQIDKGLLAAPEMPMFMSVQMLEPPPALAGLSDPERRLAAPVPVRSSRPQPGLIKIELVQTGVWERIVS